MDILFLFELASMFHRHSQYQQTLLYLSLNLHLCFNRHSQYQWILLYLHLNLHLYFNGYSQYQQHTTQSATKIN